MTPETLYLIPSYVGTVLLLGFAAAVFLRARRRGADARALYALCFSLTMWGLALLESCVQLPGNLQISFRPMSVFTLTAGNLFVIVCLFYPLEVARPGWITLRRTAWLIAPYAGITLFYFGTLALLDQPVRELRSIPDMLANLGEFNVWFRIVLYLTVCLYIVYLLMNTGIRAIEIGRKSGIRPADRLRARWLTVYGIGIAFIAVAYLVVLLHGTAVCLALHRAIVVVFFTIITTHALFGSPHRAETSPEA